MGFIWVNLVLWSLSNLMGFMGYIWVDGVYFTLIKFSQSWLQIRIWDKKWIYLKKIIKKCSCVKPSSKALCSNLIPSPIPPNNQHPITTYVHNKANKAKMNDSSAFKRCFLRLTFLKQTSKEWPWAAILQLSCVVLLFAACVLLLVWRCSTTLCLTMLNPFCRNLSMTMCPFSRDRANYWVSSTLKAILPKIGLLLASFIMPESLLSTGPIASKWSRAWDSTRWVFMFFGTTIKSQRASLTFQPKIKISLTSWNSLKSMTWKSFSDPGPTYVQNGTSVDFLPGF